MNFLSRGRSGPLIVELGQMLIGGVPCYLPEPPNAPNQRLELPLSRRLRANREVPPGPVAQAAR